MLDTNQVHQNFESGNRITVFHGDRLGLLEQIYNAGECAELIITSPPYNENKEYEENISMEQYIAEQRQTIEYCLKILSPTGNICWQVGHHIYGMSRGKEAFPLDLVLYPIFKSLGLRLHNRIVWSFGHGLHDTYRFSGRHETILWFSRATESYTFNLDPVRIPQKYPNKKHYRGKKRGELSGNPMGKNPSDVWEIPNVKSNHIEKTEHPCQFPIGLAARLILALSNENDLVVDPYLGSGATAVAALLNNRRIAGSDTQAKYIDIAKGKIEETLNGTIQYREMNRPVYQPSKD